MRSVPHRLVLMSIVLASAIWLVGPVVRAHVQAQQIVTERQIAAHPLVGTWELQELHRGPAVQSISPVANPVGILIQDAAGNVMEIVTTAARPVTLSPSEQFTSYQAFWGSYAAGDGNVTYRIRGDMDPGRMGQQAVRSFERKGTQLVLTESRAGGPVTRTVWERIPELEGLQEYQHDAIGFWQWVSAGLFDGKDANVRPAYRDESAIVYTPTGHMAVLYLGPPGRKRFAGPMPTNEEAVAATRGSVSYFGTYLVQPKSRAVYHYQLAAAVPANVGGSFMRNFEIKGSELFLRFPPQMLNGQRVQNRLTLKRLGGLRDMWPGFDQ
jgi:Lipocalin-like domain